MAVPTIVFDLDGTLVDTAPDLVETLNVIFVREGLAPLPYDTARNLVGGGVKADSQWNRGRGPCSCAGQARADVH